MTLAGTLRTWGRMVRFHHSVFALPFALAGAALAAVGHGIEARQVLWILVAMVAARNAAMGFNRLADHDLDARNPRTAGRELPRGVLARSSVWIFTACLSIVFVIAAFRLNRACGILSFPALAFVLAYSYAKRFTWASHLWLGLSLGIAPVAAWLAVRGSIGWGPCLLSAAVLLWVAGFDVLYACQDVEFDRSEGLLSIPARFGVGRALAAARAMHAGTLAALAAVGWTAGLHWIYWPGLGAVAVILVWEHLLVREDDLSRIGTAFFDMNGILSVLYLAVVLAAVAVPGWRG